MSPANDASWRGVASALIRSYAADLRAWAAKLATAYAVAVVILIGGVLALFAAIAVGITALFNLIENRFGVEIAYGAIGGGLLVVAIVLLLVGLAMLRRRTPPLPRPRRQLQDARQKLTGSTALGAIGWSRSATAKANPTTKLLIAAAGTMLAGWIVAARLRTGGRQ